MSHKFPHGQIVMTRGVSELGLAHGDMMKLLNRHLTGDWGELDDHDKKVNDTAVRTGARILSSYTVTVQDDQVRIWLITEADRSVTTYLLPSEY